MAHVGGEAAGHVVSGYLRSGGSGGLAEPCSAPAHLVLPVLDLRPITGKQVSLLAWHVHKVI